MGREIRRVPKNWEHPKRMNKYSSKAEFKPMMDYNFKESYVNWEKELKEWYQEQADFEKGKVFSYKDNVYSKINGNTYEDWAGEPPSPPNPYDYMPKGNWYQLFENVSEGTPLSPPFETKEELVRWLTDNLDFWQHQWTREQAKAMLKIGWSPSGIMANGKYYNSQEAVELSKGE